MSENDNKVVPFGKYKGRPLVEVIETDPAYLQWLTAQDWFREKFVTLHQTIINRGAETEETPDHNALQVLFLEDEFCWKFCQAHDPEIDRKTKARLARDQKESANSNWSQMQIREAKQSVQWASDALDHHIKYKAHDKKSTSEYLAKKELEYKELKQKIGRSNSANDVRNLTGAKQSVEEYTKRLASFDEDFEKEKIEREKFLADRTSKLNELCAARAALMAPIENLESKFEREFEHHGVDVRLTITTHSINHRNTNLGADHREYKIEIKPTVGDDYPAVLRQMKRNGSKILFLKDYTGVGATKDQFIKTFAASEFSVVFLRDCQ